MTDTQLYLTIGIPSMLIVLAWLQNYSHARRSDERMDRFEAGLNVMTNDLKQFYRDLGNQDGRLQAIERRTT